MSLSMPSRRLVRGAASPATATALQSLTLHPPSQSRPLSTTTPQKWFWSKKDSSSSPTNLKDAITTGTATARKSLISKLQSRSEAPAIFEDEVAPQQIAVEAKEEAALSGENPPDQGPLTASQKRAQPKTFTRLGGSLVKEALARSVNPDPQARIRWERKMAIRQVTNGTDAYSVEPRLSRIARTERVLKSKSPWLPTSVKKLVHLARQIQGKNVEDALVQMKYSKKKMAAEVTTQLKIARDLAIVERGMGLGNSKEGGDKTTPKMEIQRKDGKWMTVGDQTKMYIAEAWVNKGPLRARNPDYRARGRMFLKDSPSTSLSVVLKEHKTLVREHQEREYRKKKQGPWVHLPDRPITAQRAHYSW
ncbi:putative mitochondrial LSU ribosomal protein L22 precursor [Triangularia setosa]|uniref:Mitochondrial LSU ribosomal protein L22 n=1 Tax=Triangularia setosa TaxID=2587417 RepID=A0AAN7A5N6_9PEZI|nr:putative mitochondrial LSU ribosomal protein L22 precursor [Podospora setosa]